MLMPSKMPPSTAPAEFSIWSFCYAKGTLPHDFTQGSPVGSNLGIWQVPMVYSVIAAPPAVGKRELFLVDTGFATGRSMTGRVFDDFEKPDAVLAKIEVEPEDIETILLTHLHFDHAGNLDAFPNAKIILQRSEYARWKHVLKNIGDKPKDKTNWVLSSLNLDDIATFERAMADGRVTFIDGSHEVVPGVSLHLAADTHTFGSQYIVVATPDGPYVVAGDAVACYANLERMWPPGYHQGNTWNLVETYDKLKERVGDDLSRIVPGHDMRVFTQLPHKQIGLNPISEVRLAKNQKSFVS
jgi:glyoxylase-like metal-dependent hydrolase (beta-lactamase superfamily II)